MAAWLFFGGGGGSIFFLAFLPTTDHALCDMCDIIRGMCVMRGTCVMCGICVSCVTCVECAMRDTCVTWCSRGPAFAGPGCAAAEDLPRGLPTSASGLRPRAGQSQHQTPALRSLARPDVLRYGAVAEAEMHRTDRHMDNLLTENDALHGVAALCRGVYRAFWSSDVSGRCSMLRLLEG